MRKLYNFFNNPIMSIISFISIFVIAKIEIYITGADSWSSMSLFSIIMCYILVFILLWNIIIHPIISLFKNNKK